MSGPISLSIIAASALVDFRWVFFSFLDIGVHAGAGYFHAFIHEEEPPNGGGIHVFAGGSIGFLLTKALSLDVWVRTMQSLGLDNSLTVGIASTFRI